jgi:redox-sensitive bicupin YhaK (pirin superfamily)
VGVRVVVRRRLDRFLTREPARQTWHSFSFGTSYDPERTSFGPLFALNDELLGPGAGHAAHEHADVVLVTWVVLGELRHTDESGTVLQPAGELAVTHAGSGTTHSEVAAQRATRFVQMWLRPGEPGGTPTREHAVPDLAAGGLVHVAGTTGLRLDVPGAELWLGALTARETVTLPAAARVYAFVVTGALARSSLAEPLAAGDAFEISETDGGVGHGLSVTAAVPTQLLVWAFAG